MLKLSIWFLLEKKHRLEMGRGDSNIIASATAPVRCRRLLAAKAGLQNARESSHH